MAVKGRRRRVHTPLPEGARPTLPAGAVELDTTIGTLWFDDADQHMTPWVRTQGIWETEVMGLLSATLRPGGVFVDAGANIGFHTVLASQLVGHAGTVVAIEPNPWTLELLRANVWRHGSGAVILPVAASDSPGTVHLEVDTDHRSGAHFGRAGIAVDAAPLDQLVPDAVVDVLKIDVEGAEPLVVRGAQALLERSPRMLAVVEFRDEPHVGGEGPAEVLAFYESLGFELCLLRRDGELKPAGAEEVLTAARSLPIVNLVLRRR